MSKLPASDRQDDGVCRQQGLLPPLLRVLVVDDEPLFGRIIEAEGKRDGVSVTYCQSVEDVLSRSPWAFDIGIFDCDLGRPGGMGAVDLAVFLEVHAGAMSFVLISQTEAHDNLEWPPCIGGYVSKAVGPFAILRAAFHVYAGDGARSRRFEAGRAKR